MYEKLKEYNNLYTREERKQLTASAIKAFRIQSNLQQKEVAGLLGINTQTYQGYENGRNEPPIEVLVRLSFLYEVPIDVLVQSDNFDKNKNATTAIIEEYERQIAELKEKLKTADPLTKAQIEPMIKAIEAMTETIKKKT